VKWNRAKGRKDRNVIDARGSSPSAGSGGGLPIPGNIAGIGGGAGVTRRTSGARRTSACTWT
jgi:hypothetical protein